MVRPATSTQAQDTKAVLEQRKKRLDEFKAELKYEAERLRENRMTIDEERDYAESGEATATYRAQYERFVERYQKDMERYEDQKAKYRRLEREYRADKSEYGFTSSLTTSARSSRSRSRTANRSVRG